MWKRISSIKISHQILKAYDKWPAECENLQYTNNIEWFKMLSFRVRRAPANKSRNNAAEPDWIMIEMLSDWDDFNMNKITEIIDEIYDSGETTEDLSNYIFSYRCLGNDENKCKFRLTIILMCHKIKLFIRILMNRPLSRIKPKIAQELVSLRYGDRKGDIYYQNEGERNTNAEGCIPKFYRLCKSVWHTAQRTVWAARQVLFIWKR